MKPANPETRHPHGPTDPIPIAVDPDTLQKLQLLKNEFGNVFSMVRPNGRSAYFINDADEVRKMLVKRHARYRKGPGFERVKMLLGNGLIVSDGDVWRRSRTMIQPAFSRQNVHRLITLMVDCTQRKAQAWKTVAESGGDLNISQEMSDFALELILRCIFGPDYERRIVANGKNPFEFLSKQSERDLSIVLQLRDLRELLLSIIAERKTSTDREQYDFLSIYLGTRDKEGKHFTDDELLDELMTLIVAGYETSAGTLNWAWYLLAGHPEVEARMLREAAEQMPDAGAVDQQVLKDMVYAQQVLDETLRLYPPVWLFSRRAQEDDALEHYDVPAGTDIYLSPYILHRSEEYWSDPEEFDPERFGTDGPYKKGDRPYFPFSLGPRRCLGEYFSFLEMKVHLGLLIQKFRMTLVTAEPPGLDLGINLRSLNDIILRPEIRD